MTSPKKAIPKIDYGIILTLILMTLASLIAIYSAQSTGQYVANFVKQQVMWYVIGTIVIIVVIQFDSDQMKKYFLVCIRVLLVAINNFIFVPYRFTAYRKKKRCTKLVFHSESGRHPAV